MSYLSQLQRYCVCGIVGTAIVCDPPAIAQSAATLVPLEVKSSDHRPKIEVIPQISTLGIGVSAAIPVSNTLKIRVGLNGAALSTSPKPDQVQYEGTTRLSTLSAGVDYYPLGADSMFFISGGLAYQSNRTDLTAKPSSSNTYTLNGNSYWANYSVGVGTLSGEYRYPNSFAPYVGVGLGSPISADEGFSFWGNLGVLLAGKPSVTLNASGPLAGDPYFQRDLAIEQDRINQALGGADIYPILSVGFSYKF